MSLADRIIDLVDEIEAGTVNTAGLDAASVAIIRYELARLGVQVRRMAAPAAEPVVTMPGMLFIPGALAANLP
ncbi:hypothetical protein [Plastoroseomonas hellenica]|uniref:hypothetical protein n=1 Tax=Plastoroseomonas hellenica TaxID=2687306 RepID=UPI001BA7318E|nr:hypothetical protein [Plastoroseomonas hellenica]MBR0644015.1 hypothetical protein [Plastoroseomonas hellenica]